MTNNGPGVQLVEGGYFAPRGILGAEDLIYDANRQLVSDSVTRRRTPLDSQPPLVLPPDLKVREVSNSLLFIGHFYDTQGYGHWITEGLARFWFLLRHQLDGARIPCAGFSVPRSIVRAVFKFQGWRHAFRVFGVTRTDRLVCRSVVKAPLIIVPRCSVELGLTLHAAHLEVTRTIARHLLRDGATKQNARPVYSSRTRLRYSERTILGEEAVGQYCRSRGFLVVHPERMSLRNQVQLFNTHETFVGVLGSAFHSTLFRLVGPARHVYLYDSGRARPTYRLIDELMGNTALSVRCADRAADRAKQWTLNLQSAVAQLRNV